MSKEATIQKIRNANTILSFAKTLYHQLLALEKKENEEVRYWFDSLVLIQTSIYSTLVLNLYHLLKKGEKHSIHELIRTSKAHLGLKEESVGKMLTRLDEVEKIEELKENRDKRIAHFDKGDIGSLNDPTIKQLLKVAEEILIQLNDEALKISHSYGIPMSRGMENIMSALMDKIKSEKQATKS